MFIKQHLFPMKFGETLRTYRALDKRVSRLVFFSFLYENIGL